MGFKTYIDNAFQTALEKTHCERPEIAVLELGYERTRIIFNEQDKIITTMTDMPKEEIARSAMQGTFTGKLATVLISFQFGLYWIMRIAKEGVE